MQDDERSRPTLVVMAAGIGSRFGGTKQLAGVGPSGEAILDYTIADARAAGFDRVVLIVRSSIAEAVSEHLRRFHDGADRFAMVCQDLDGRAPRRDRPWGTGHAILTVAAEVAGPFAVVNADDFYGRAALADLADALAGGPPDGGHFHLMAYELANTLSARGTVSRGVCRVDPSGDLADITEHLSIARTADGTIRSADAAPTDPPLADDTPVSMNLWGLQPTLFAVLEDGFARFVAEHQGEEKAEFLLPSVIGGLVSAGQVRVQVHRTTSEWLGVTYPGDLDDARARIAELVRDGTYPTPLASPAGA